MNLYEPVEMNEKEKRIPTALRISLGAVIFCLLFLVFFLLVNYIMNSGEIYFRTWAQQLGRGICCLGLPTAIVICIWQVLQQRKKSPAVVVGKVSLLVAYVIIICAMSLFMLVSVLLSETETKMENGFLGGEAVCYEEYTWLLKKRYIATFDWVSKEMEKQYQIKVVHTEKLAEQTGFGRYTLVTATDTPLTFHVFPGLYFDFPNDYIQVKANRIIRAKAAKICPDRPLTDLHEEGLIRPERVTGISLPCYGREDAEECSRIASELIKEVLKDPLCKEEGAQLVLECQGVDDRVKNIVLPLGEYRFDSGVKENDGDKYTDWSVICFRLLENYERNENAEIDEDISPDTEETLGEENYEDSTFYIEGAYKALFEKLFAPEDYPYDTRYNAKGNFYAYLAEGNESLESVDGIFRTVETVVYDRVSKNEKCHLFVHYKDYYRGSDQSPYTTGIVNMYAVDMETGEVYIADRHAWADVGTEEYCEATGEP